eukprot:gene2440-2743_t
MAGSDCWQISSSRRQHKDGRIPLQDLIRFKERQWFVEELENARDADPNAMLRLAKMYLHGQGCQRNIAMAQEWVRKARSMGVPATLDELFATDDPDARGKLRSLAAQEERRRALRRSNPNAASVLADSWELKQLTSAGAKVSQTTLAQLALPKQAKGLVGVSKNLYDVCSFAKWKTLQLTHKRKTQQAHQHQQQLYEASKEEALEGYRRAKQQVQKQYQELGNKSHMRASWLGNAVQ